MGSASRRHRRPRLSTDPSARAWSHESLNDGQTKATGPEDSQVEGDLAEDVRRQEDASGPSESCGHTRTETSASPSRPGNPDLLAQRLPEEVRGDGDPDRRDEGTRDPDRAPAEAPEEVPCVRRTREGDVRGGARLRRGRGLAPIVEGVRRTGHIQGATLLPGAAGRCGRQRDQPQRRAHPAHGQEVLRLAPAVHASVWSAREVPVEREGPGR